MNAIFYLLIIVFAINSSNAQPFEKHYYFLNDTINKADQNLKFLKITNSTNGRNEGYVWAFGSTKYKAIFLSKTDLNGNIIWSKKYLNGLYKNLNFLGALLPTQDGGTVITVREPMHSISVFKVDSWGSVLWSESVGGLYSTSGSGHVLSSSTFNQGYLIYNSGSLGGNNYLLKIDSIGKTQWIKQQNDSTTILSFGITKDSNYFLFGSKNKTPILKKIAPDGSLLWAKKYSHPSSLYQDGLVTSSRIIHTKDSGYIFTTWIGKHSNILVVKLDKNGTVMWSKGYSLGTLNDMTAQSGFAINELPNDYYLITANRGNDDIYLVKIDSAGSPIWGKVAAKRPLAHYSTLAYATPDSGIVSLSSIQTSTQSAHFSINKIDSSGISCAYRDTLFIEDTVILSTSLLSQNWNAFYNEPILNSPYTSLNNSVREEDSCKPQVSKIKENYLQFADVYPNPSDNGYFKVTFSKITTGKIEVFNSIGKRVVSQEIKNDLSTSIQLKEVSGVYYIKIVCTEGQYTHKIAIQ